MKTTALIREHQDSLNFLLTFNNISDDTSNSFLNFLQSEAELTELLKENYSDRGQNRIGFESRIGSEVESKILLNGIERFCHMYKIVYRAEQLGIAMKEDELKQN